MTRNEITRRFPKASEDFIRANLSPDAALPDAEPCERKKALATDRERETQGAGLLHCCFTLARKKLLDVDAKFASTKDLLDCLTIAGVIRGDKEGQITLQVEQRKIQKGETEHTIIEVLKP
jgi:hypothetical protein